MSFPEGPHTLTRVNYREAVAAGREAELDAAALDGLDASGVSVLLPCSHSSRRPARLAQALRLMTARLRVSSW